MVSESLSIAFPTNRAFDIHCMLSGISEFPLQLATYYEVLCRPIPVRRNAILEKTEATFPMWNAEGRSITPNRRQTICHAGGTDSRTRQIVARNLLRQNHIIHAFVSKLLKRHSNPSLAGDDF
eukprot:scaffold328888_cov45-Prasinocladus_malaysianus.AAC.1